MLRSGLKSFPAPSTSTPAPDSATAISIPWPEADGRRTYRRRHARRHRETGTVEKLDTSTSTARPGTTRGPSVSPTTAPSPPRRSVPIPGEDLEPTVRAGFDTWPDSF